MRELDSPQSLLDQETAIRDVILSKLQPVALVTPAQQETVAYRLAEIFVAARQLYTDVLPRFLELPTPAPQPPAGAAASKKDSAGGEAGSADASAEGQPAPGSAVDDAVFEVFGEVRMNLLHLRDLVEDFEEKFLESLSDRLDLQGEPIEEEDDEI